VTDPTLTLDGVYASYDKGTILHGVSLYIDPGEVVSLVGRNGVGKTTTLRCIAGVLTPTRGEILLNGESITSLSKHQIVQRGVSYVPEDRQIFPDLTVAENLRLGRLHTGEGVLSLEEIFEQFPRLDERRGQKGATLSGGEQQMLSIARALLNPTEILLLDEPTEGLAPQIVDDVLDIIADIKEQGVTVLLVEQNVTAAMEVATRHYVLEQGEIVFEGSTEELDADNEVQEQYLGVAVDTDFLE